MPTDADVRLLLDRMAIGDLLVAFASRLDEKDFEGYAALFTEKGTLELPGLVHQGRAGLADLVARDLGRYHRTHHISTNHQITVDDDEAASRSYLHAVHLPEEADPTHWWSVGGWYDNTYLREGGQWRISGVRVTPVWLGGTAFPPPPPADPV
ncbi:nuclear transport factor 2 family protein [Streptomyces sp. NPDC050211]|uniref:nuclear transport factor 2 family protein n=1 Tax=Streptomyces sp. NPDC050211 TaxID=3154932 RepID=UPI003436F378